MKEISAALRAKGAKHMRLNSIGLGNLIHGRNIAPDLSKILDSICISLNTPDPEVWAKIHRPQPQFREKGFEGVLDFIRECAKVIPDTFVTAVDVPSLDKPRFEKLVQGLGAKTRIRPYLDEYESR
jgi:TatD family-associated radical SAM protein